MGSGKMQESSRTTTEIPQWLQDKWSQLTGAAAGEAFKPVEQYSRDQLIAQPGEHWNQWMQGGLDLYGNRPDFSTVSNLLMDQAAMAQNQVQDPNKLNIGAAYSPERYGTGQFGVGDVGVEDTLAGFKPEYDKVTGAQVKGTDFQARDYTFNPQQVSAQQINAPGRGTIRDVAPIDKELQSYLLANPERINIPALEKYQMQAPRDVVAGQTATNMFVDPGVRQQYMSPYMQDVVDIERRKATESYNQQRAAEGLNAAAAGALGGSRQAILQGEMSRDFQTQMGDIQRQGLQAAFENAQAQFERDRAASMGTQQFNVNAGLQAALANQQMGYNVGRENLQSLLGTQALGTNATIQAGIANQQAALDAAKANQQALLGTQALGYNTGLEAQRLNQAAD